MTLRQLEYLIEVAEHGSISLAARKLIISQPSLSQCIKNLENELGATLFDRNSVPMVPTKAGEIVLHKAHIMMTAMEDMKKEQYLSALCNLFGVKETNNKSESRLQNILISMQRWFRALPQVTKNIKSKSNILIIA